MTTAKEVLIKYNKLVEFPITPEKIQAAGYDVDLYLIELIKALEAAEDSQEHPIIGRLSKLREDRQRQSCI